MYIWILLIICIVLFLLIYNNTKSIKSIETFESDYSDYNSIDRIKIHDQLNYTSGISNFDDKFAYCIGGRPTCLTGSPIKIGVYGNGNTYRSICDDGSNITCNNVISSNIGNDICDNYIWKTPNNIPILFSNIYKGFTTPTNHIPAVINNNSINFYDMNNNIIDTINKCSVLGVNENNCKKALNIPFPLANTYQHISGTYKYDPEEINKELGYIQDDPLTSSTSNTGSYTQTILKGNGKSGMYPSLPCIADYGASPGDNVCNGEIGLIQDNTLICPYNKPICSGYRCDSKFGTCVDSR